MPDKWLPVHSHLEVLSTCLNMTNGPAIEFGIGFYSTPLFAVYSKRFYCRSLENSRYWSEKMKPLLFLGCEQHELMLCESYAAATIDDRRWGLAFIDQSGRYDKDAQGRMATLERIKDQAEIIVVHDAERRWYWNKIKSFRQYVFYRHCRPYTAIMSNLVDLSQIHEAICLVLGGNVNYEKNFP